MTKQDLEHENARMKRILEDVLRAVWRMGAEDEHPAVRGWSTQLQAVEMCEVQRILGDVRSFTPHSGGPGVVGPATFNTAR